MTILNDISDKNAITIFSIDLNKNLNSEFYQKIKQSWIEKFPHNRIIIYDRDDEEVRECLDSEYCKKLLSWNCLNYACNLPRANILSKHDKYLYMDLDVWVYDGSFIEDLNENTWFESYFNNRPANIYCLAYSGIGHSEVFNAQKLQMNTWSDVFTFENWIKISADYLLIHDIDNCFQRKGYIHFSFWPQTSKIFLHTNKKIENCDYCVDSTLQERHIYFNETPNSQYFYCGTEGNSAQLFSVDKSFQIFLIKKYFENKNIQVFIAD